MTVWIARAKSLVEEYPDLMAALELYEVVFDDASKDDDILHAIRMFVDVSIDGAADTDAARESKKYAYRLAAELLHLLREYRSREIYSILSNMPEVDDAYNSDWVACSISHVTGSDIKTQCGTFVDESGIVDRIIRGSLSDVESLVHADPSLLQKHQEIQLIDVGIRETIKTLLDVAAISGKSDMYEYFATHDIEPTAATVCYAVIGGNINIVTSLIDVISAMDSIEKEFALEYAVKYHRNDIADWLLHVWEYIDNDRITNASLVKELIPLAARHRNIEALIILSDLSSQLPPQNDDIETRIMLRDVFCGHTVIYNIIERLTNNVFAQQQRQPSDGDVYAPFFDFREHVNSSNCREVFDTTLTSNFVSVSGDMMSRVYKHLPTLPYKLTYVVPTCDILVAMNEFVLHDPSSAEFQSAIPEMSQRIADFINHSPYGLATKTKPDYHAELLERVAYMHEITHPHTSRVLLEIIRSQPHDTLYDTDVMRRNSIYNWATARNFIYDDHTFYDNNYKQIVDFITRDDVESMERYISQHEVPHRLVRFLLNDELIMDIDDEEEIKECTTDIGDIFRIITYGTLIDLAAFYGAVKCYRRLHNNTQPFSRLAHVCLSIIGGNTDIFNIAHHDYPIETANIECFRYAIMYHRFNILDLMMDMYPIWNQTHRDDVICEAIRCLNVPVLILSLDAKKKHIPDTGNEILERRELASDMLAASFNMIAVEVLLQVPNSLYSRPSIDTIDVATSGMRTKTMSMTKILLPLYYAVKKNRVDTLIDFAVDYELRRNRPHVFGIDPIKLILQDQKIDMLRALHEHGVDVKTYVSTVDEYVVKKAIVAKNLEFVKYCVDVVGLKLSQEISYIDKTLPEIIKTLRECIDVTDPFYYECITYFRSHGVNIKK